MAVDPHVTGPASAVLSPLDGDVGAAERWALLPGVRVLPRSDGALQIGTEPPRWAILTGAPIGTLELLRLLDGRQPLAAVLAEVGLTGDRWHGVLGALRDAGLLIRASEWILGGAPEGRPLAMEHASLALRHGAGPARRILLGRRESAVLVDGSGPVALGLAELLRAGGVGRVDQSGGGVRRWVRAADPDRVRPDLVVLTGGTDADPFRRRTQSLLAAGVPHLDVQLGWTLGSVGPLALPGRTACALCLVRHRADADPGWPAVQLMSTTASVRPPLALCWTAAGIAAAEVLAFLDGDTSPSTVGGTVEWTAGSIRPRRRSWALHPDCECAAFRPAEVPFPDTRARGEEQ
jgi:hypothetical protein